jgi:hypothetical protein
MKGACLQRVQLPPANWFAPPVNNAEARVERVLGVLAFLFSIMISKATRMTNSDQFRVPECVTLLLESAEVASC